MPTDKAKKTTVSKTTPKPTANKVKVATPMPTASPVVEDKPERQSQFATILIGLLIIACGLLIYNYFLSVNQPATTTSNQAKATPTPIVKNNQKPITTQGSYTVQRGDTLWGVAEKVYGDGFQWQKIAAANSLQHDSAGRPVVTVGQVLVVPDSAASTAVASNNNITPTPTPTVAAASTDDDKHSTNNTNGTGSQNIKNINQPTAGATYTVKHGDTLWNIAQVAYGNGASWILIFDDSRNRLGILPNGRPLIHAGNILYLPHAP